MNAIEYLLNNNTEKGVVHIPEVIIEVAVEDYKTLKKFAADVAPVKYGKWKKIQNFAKCSECRHEVNWGSKDFLSPYCPNCGAKMDGKDGEDNG